MNNNQKKSGEIYLEFQSLGASQKVSAIDPVTGIEVAVTGPANTPRDKITQIAVQKLQRRLEREASDNALNEVPQKGILL